MKKRLIIPLGVLIMSLTIGLNIFSKSNINERFSEIILVNSEALANGESGSSGYTEQEYICKTCGSSYKGCFYCTEDPNTCSCSASTHSH